ncbi:PREDICTED: mitochondrial pyruvate carrier 2-like [Bactrocera latifrons]|uniref:Mitochondrial pyruvate carrier n=1 Tax=Bactrocera latifrons TaxID=174628 RepID=A0A0K8UTJ3_BACLA|nr:PREDICTED: mitochondrial pyruvate carrier 2-like [Bactrocera latifrons]XP_018788125.1 PREDICTED: mitochondrial pyruvate carrier 2-like [Bactrocera latifrons]XP_039965582.1 mitochondrial pyruvate carrier 2-like [Bactrocera tryoni]XP_039965592.1 mitochondrial pyruvate carrier 2-like [Bactrocera tryoni]XP_050317087.1 mitochondrial pyruvate carrier 2-like [Bactrocera neohumeralis]XP_050317088.1 mitochondrial pyruvate carrier 2-like [Bactrocera neohumeralis]
MASSAPPAAAPPPPPPPSATTAGKGFPNKIYNALIGSVDKHVPEKLRPLWQHPAGPKTVFFWAPLFKWSLVIAGLSDLARPAETLSVPQCAALAATGIIWSRYSLVIIPKNYSLFAVNLFVGLTQVVQLGRAYNYQMEQNKLAGEQPAKKNEL